MLLPFGGIISDWFQSIVPFVFMHRFSSGEIVSGDGEIVSGDVSSRRRWTAGTFSAATAIQSLHTQLTLPRLLGLPFRHISSFFLFLSFSSHA
jgi:hypothetical protein